MSKREEIAFLQAELESSQALVRAYRERLLQQEKVYDQVMVDFRAAEEYFKYELNRAISRDCTVSQEALDAAYVEGAEAMARLGSLLPLGARCRPSEPLT